MPSATPPGCRKFSKRILIWDPHQSLPMPNGETEIDGYQELSKELAPGIILLFTWADAQPRHYLKYIEGYQNLYPKAKIILSKATTLRTFFGGQKAAQHVVRDMVHHELVPLFAAESKSAGSPASRPGILAHAFSNSGALNFEATCSVWHEVFGADVPLPLTALILDSTPGGTTYKTEFNRWTTGVSNGLETVLPKPISWVIAAVVILSLMVIPQVVGIDIMATRGPRALNKTRNIAPECARLYVYSMSDELIYYRDVEAHAEDARQKGYQNVILERFEASSHVSHLRMDPMRYWNAVWKVWNVGCMIRR